MISEMLRLLSWIHIGVILFLSFTLASIDTATPTKKELGEMRRKLAECCATNVCIRSSCFSMEWRPSAWAIVRQRCQNRYPDWPYAVDIFRVQTEEDVRILRNIMHMPDYLSSGTGPPITVWTSGTRCPKSSSEGIIFKTQWISTNHSFPNWLEEKLNSNSSNVTDYNDSCKFLVMSQAPNKEDVLYDFQDQNAKHGAICEFFFPGEGLFSTTDHEVTEERTTQQETSPDAVKSTNSPTTRFLIETSTSSTTTQKSKTRNPEGKYESQDSSLENTDPLTIRPMTSQLPHSTTEDHAFCEETEVLGIHWPKTKPGATANVSCPEGMTGYAQWKCDEKTFRFTPERPHVENCKHVWIKGLEEEVEDGHDAVEISSKLAKQTQNKSMSHGDITALVDLSTRLLHLYSQQKGEEEYELTEEQQKPPVSYVFTKSMVASISNILRAEIKKAWEVLPEIHQTREATKILKLVTTMGSRLSCIRKSTNKLQFTVTAENIDLQTFILNNVKEDDDKIVFPQQTDDVKWNSTISVPADLKLRYLFSPCRNYNTAVGVIYKHVGDFLKDEKISDSTTQLATKVISFSLSNKTEAISLPKGKEVSIVLQHILQQDVRHKILINPRCVFWNFSKKSYGQWDSSGCELIYFNETHTVCKCNHLTNFAVLMDINNNIKEDKILSLMTYICCGISSLTLLLTLICFFTIRTLHGRRSIITGNLCFSLLITNLLIIFGLDQTQTKVLCAVIAGFLHFWILSAFCWMLVEGYHLYRMVILVFQRGSNLPVKLYYVFAYGAPLVVVGISAGLRSDDYGGDDYCWLSTSKGLMWSFVGPACAVILVNIIIFTLTLRSASSVRIKREQSSLKKIKSWVRGSMSVMCLLGLTWCLGLFYIDKKLHIFSYIFTVLNGLQGVFIFLFHILLNDKVNSMYFCRCKESQKDKRKKFFNQTSSNRLHSKTSTRTSVNSIGCISSNPPALNSRTMSTTLPSHEILSPTNSSGNSVQTKKGAKSVKHHNINYRKHKATHTISENGLSHATNAHHSKIRSQSFPEGEANRMFLANNLQFSRELSTKLSSNTAYKQ